MSNQVSKDRVVFTDRDGEHDSGWIWQEDYKWKANNILFTFYSADKSFDKTAFLKPTNVIVIA